DRIRVNVRGRYLDVRLQRADLRAGEAVSLVVRPETMRLSPASPGGAAAFSGIIRRAVYLGATVEYEIDWDGTTLLVIGGSPLEHGLLPEGARVAFDFPAATAHVLPRPPSRAA
ncbi:MAG: TOBE domain-containing protein, partial [candidate division NC10 bacterium]|nr:TOBE domain-containing protein [candidate division NC10 bacterium]